MWGLTWKGPCLALGLEDDVPPSGVQLPPLDSLAIAFVFAVVLGFPIIFLRFLPKNCMSSPKTA
jgi:hypothetical protein